MNPDLLERGQQAIARGLGWLRDNASQISQIEDLSAHYKAPYLYAVQGDPLRARYYADLMEGRYLQADGDFRTRPGDRGWADAPAMPAVRYLYPNGWIIVGLRKLGVYGAARRGIDFVRRFQSPQLGGFFSGFDASSGQVDRRYLDSSSTSSAGLALLACGLVEEAIPAGDFLLRLLKAQPEPERNFYTTWDAEAGLVTDVWGQAGQRLAWPRVQFCLSTEADPLKELTWLAGKAMKFLAKLYDQTSDRKYLDGAVSLFDFFHRLDEGRWENTGSCKIMWASAELYRHTGDRRFAETAEHIFDVLCQTQTPEGVWVHTVIGSLDKQPMTATVDIAQELCAEMTDVMFDLSPAA
ncbi:MAG: hypothetical protein Kow0063_26170 [Anaerolineae bacterium]